MKSLVLFCAMLAMRSGAFCATWIGVTAGQETFLFDTPDGDLAAGQYAVVGSVYYYRDLQHPATGYDFQRILIDPDAEELASPRKTQQGQQIRSMISGFQEVQIQRELGITRNVTYRIKRQDQIVEDRVRNTAGNAYYNYFFMDDGSVRRVRTIGSAYYLAQEENGPQPVFVDVVTP